MSSSGPWVVDTNLLISRLLLPNSIPVKAVQAAMEEGDLLVSDATLEELADVISRPKFDKYITAAERREFFELLARVAVRKNSKRGGTCIIAPTSWPDVLGSSDGRAVPGISMGN